MASTSTAEASSAMKQSPNWLEMPDEVMVDIFQRLTIVEILNCVRKVCTTWLKLCKYPAIWKVITMLKQSGTTTWSFWNHALAMLAEEAINLSRGELIDISIERFGTDQLLDHIALRASKLKRLCLVSCTGITGSRLSLAVKKLPQLEALHLSDTYIKAREIEAIGRNCPQLKYFELSNVSKATNFTGDDHVHAIANTMPELRHLDLRETDITNNALEAILNGCPHLESLYVCMSYNLDLDGNLGKMCVKRIKDFKHGVKEKCRCYYHISDVEDFS